MAHLNPATHIVTLQTIARYSASADDLDMFVCFFDFHEIIEEPRKMQYLDTDLQVV